jgi:hypothetical protein
VEVDPYIADGEVPAVEHVVPLPGIAAVPVTAGAGLIPGDASSVAPSGMPVGETVEPVPRPSGEVAPMLGVGLAIPLICAVAALQTTSTGRTAAINADLIGILLLKTWDRALPNHEPHAVRSAAADVQCCGQRRTSEQVTRSPVRSIKYDFILDPDVSASLRECLWLSED